MDDAQYVLMKDTQEKKRTAYSASKRVGSTKKCTLPYENMSGAERKKYMEASEVMTYKMKPMPLAEFRKVPGDMKLELLKWYGGKYGWNGMGIAAALGTTYTTASRLLEEHMLTGMFKARMKEATLEQKRQFIENRKALEEQASKAPVQELPAKGHPTPEPEEKPTQGTTGETTDRFTIQLNLTKNGETLERQLRGVAASLDRGKEYRISLLVTELSSD